MPELAAPLRVTWELPADPGAAVEQWRALAADRVLFVELCLLPGAEAALASLAPLFTTPGAPRLTLAAGAAGAAAAAERLSAAVLAGVELLLFPPHPGGVPGGPWRSVTWALWSTTAGLGEFAGALDAARSAGGGTVAVLNPPAPAVPLTPAERRAAVATWWRGGTPEVRLRVHDLFLAEELGLAPFAAYAGCQAGDGLAHLAADGVVTACRTLPVVLGRLGRGGLRALWAGATRGVLRRQLAAAPAACTGCAAAARCRGGCRGLLPAGSGADLGARDPSCPGPRPGAEGAAA